MTTYSNKALIEGAHNIVKQVLPLAAKNYEDHPKSNNMIQLLQEGFGTVTAWLQDDPGMTVDILYDIHERILDENRSLNEGIDDVDLSEPPEEDTGIYETEENSEEADDELDLSGSPEEEAIIEETVELVEESLSRRQWIFLTGLKNTRWYI